MVIRVALIDDHHLLREAIREKLERESDIEIVAEGSDGRSALSIADQYRPDLMLLDISLPDIIGTAVAQRIRANFPDIRILALSMHTEKYFVVEMLAAGADGYVSKTSASSELLKAIRAVARGRKYLCPEVTDAVIDQIHEPADRNHSLGRRELEVLRLLAEGQRSSEIADRLSISSGTVEVHRRNIMRKLDLHSIAELTKFAIRNGLTSL
ncbi:MAG: response regulator transcription factor [Spongiibacteraceae bacterium]